jgi:hypothetical protein
MSTVKIILEVVSFLIGYLREMKIKKKLSLEDEKRINDTIATWTDLDTDSVSDDEIIRE